MREKGRLVPKLRFPSFQHAKAWTAYAGSDLFDQVSERNTQSDLPVLAITQEHGAIPRELIDYHVSVTEKSLESYKVVQPGDFIISLRSFQGGIEHSQYRGVCSPAYVILRRRGEGSDAYFKHYLKTDGFIQVLTKNLEGLRDGKMISYKQFSALQLPVPAEPEQQKIAACLSSLDELIAAQARKVDALKTHKTGLMQQLFPREGGTQPRLRLLEFKDAGNWRPRTIGQLGEVVTGSTPSTVKPEYYGGNRLFVSPADISDVRFIKKTKTTLTESGFLETRRIKASSVLFVCIGSTIGKVAQNEQECATNQQINSVIPNAEHSNGFVYYALSGLSDKISKVAGKQAVPIVNKSLFSSVELVVPNLPEQERIASLLSSIDERVFSEDQRLETLRNHKKGLMQQLFPSAGETE